MDPLAPLVPLVLILFWALISYLKGRAKDRDERERQAPPLGKPW
jgi:hypothetical protein